MKDERLLELIQSNLLDCHGNRLNEKPTDEELDF